MKLIKRVVGLPEIASGLAAAIAMRRQQLASLTATSLMGVYWMITADGSLDRATVERIVRQIVFAQEFVRSPLRRRATGHDLVVSISARHCHLTDRTCRAVVRSGSDIDAHEAALSGWLLCRRTDGDAGRASSPHAAERAHVWGRRARIVRSSWPLTDAISLGIDPGGTDQRRHRREHRDVCLVGPNGVVELPEEE